MGTLKNIELFNKKFELFLAKKILVNNNNLDLNLEYKIFTNKFKYFSFKSFG